MGTKFRSVLNIDFTRMEQDNPNMPAACVSEKNSCLPAAGNELKNRVLGRRQADKKSKQSRRPMEFYGRSFGGESAWGEDDGGYYYDEEWDDGNRWEEEGNRNDNRQKQHRAQIQHLRGPVRRQPPSQQQQQQRPGPPPVSPYVIRNSLGESVMAMDVAAPRAPGEPAHVVDYHGQRSIPYKQNTFQPSLFFAPEAGGNNASPPPPPRSAENEAGAPPPHEMNFPRSAGSARFPLPRSAVLQRMGRPGEVRSVDVETCPIGDEGPNGEYDCRCRPPMSLASTGEGGGGGGLSMDLGLSAGESYYPVDYQKRTPPEQPLITWKKKKAEPFGTLLVQRGKSNMVVRIPVHEDQKASKDQSNTYYNFFMILILILSAAWAYTY